MTRSDRRPELYAAALIPYTAAAVALVLRNVARRKTRITMVWEDYLAIVAFVSAQYRCRAGNAYVHVDNRDRIHVYQPLQYDLDRRPTNIC